MFNEEKVAQMAAYLLKKHGGSMRFIKLMYLSDRKAMESLTGKGRGLNAPHNSPASNLHAGELFYPQRQIAKTISAIEMAATTIANASG